MFTKFRSMVLLVLVVVVGFILVACQKPVYTVTFDMQGGDAVDALTVEEGSLLEFPANPTYEGYTFVGWFEDATGTTAFESEVEVTSDLTVYAVWEMITLTVTFDADGGTVIDSIVVNYGEAVSEPEAPTKDYMSFAYWYIDDENVAYDFSQAVTADLALKAKWVEDPQALIEADIAAFEANMYESKYQLNLPKKGEVGNSRILWSISSNYITSNGVILPVNFEDDDTMGTVTGIFSLAGETVSKSFDVPLTKLVEIDLDVSRDVDFVSLTSEYDLPDQPLTLHFEEDGYVPYVKVSDFFALLDTGFIDEEYELTFTKGDGTLEIFYQYYDEDFEEMYDLTCTIDANTNTITTNDPGFYWAYVASTETNYSRHIVYDLENEGNYYSEGNDVIYDLGMYNIDIPVIDGDVVLPYYIANQLFAGSSYFNIYYNYDALYGIYSLPGEGSDEYETMKTSTMNGASIPVDLAIHTLSVLAFDLDNFYGLKDIKNVDTYYDLLYDNLGSLISSSASSIDQTINNIIVDDIDELHTSYGYPSYFNRLSYTVPASSSLDDYGENFQSFYRDGLWAVDDALGAKWGYDSESWVATSGNRPNYWFLDSKTAMLSLDDFNTSDIEESATYDATIVEDILEVDDASLVLPNVVGGNKFFLYNLSSEENRLLEVIVKGIDSSYLSTYKGALVSLGYTLVNEASEDELKADGYYEKTVGDVTFMVQVTYDENLDLFYIGVADEVPETYEDDWMLIPDVEGTVYADSAVYMEIMLEQIVAEQPGVENVIFDLTWNMGGNIGALYRVLGFITDDPFAVTSYSRLTDSMSRTYVTTEGIPSYSYLNWSLLISKVTFSAGNELATIFMENDLGSIIGVQSGGGAASITPILLPNGTAFTMSSNSLNGYFVSGTGTEGDPYVFEANEFGIVPDYAIDNELLFDETTLLAILYGE